MRRVGIIGLLLLLALASCHGPFGTRSNASSDAVVSPEPQSPQRSQLLAIDSLMWLQPDSALALLLPWFDTVVSSQTFDNHYAQLLLAELLYKNDYAQTNRDELLQAVEYFDSVTATTGWADTHGVSLQDVFLAARAHYINGVGYYETDSILDACKEYMKAVETIEEWYDEKDLIGNKARFMAITFTRITDLFSEFYLHEQAVYFGKLALDYYEKYAAQPRHKAWILNEIGSHYDIMENYDSAYSYYCKGLAVLEDTNNLTYRDIATRMELLSYRRNGETKTPLNQLHYLLTLSESEKEHCGRCLTIGGILYHEREFDSSRVYLQEVFCKSSNIGARKQAAEWLVEICKAQGKDSESHEYAEFLVPFANISENQSHLKSQLTELYHIYDQNRLKTEHRKQMRKFCKYGGAALVVLAAIALVFIVFHFVNKRRHKQLKWQNEEKDRLLESERHSHKMKQAALAGRLKQRNEELRLHKEEKENIRKTCRNETVRNPTFSP